MIQNRLVLVGWALYAPIQAELLLFYYQLKRIDAGKSDEIPDIQIAS